MLIVHGWCAHVADVPNAGATIAAGFRSESSFYVGNEALNGMSISAAEMCVWHEGGACVRNCVPITASDYVYTGLEVDGLRSEIHKVIALMSGQLESVTAGAVCSDRCTGMPFCPHATFYPRHIGMDVGSRSCPDCWTCRAEGGSGECYIEAQIRGFGWGWHAWGYGVTFSREGGWGGNDHLDEMWTGDGSGFGNADCSGGREMQWSGFYIQVTASTVALQLTAR